MFRTSACLIALVATCPAVAQRTDTNVITSSDDAFGRSVGNERIGIYSSEDVRGFNPIEAGNARIEGLYFDQMSLPNNRLVDGNSIRVGYAAQAWPFPSPTGIVNYQLDKFEDDAVASFEAESDLDGNFVVSAQGKLPFAGEKLGISFGTGYRRSRVPAARYVNFWGQAANLSWRPSSSAEVNLFWSHFRSSRTGGTPILYPAGPFTPPRVERRDYLGQDWAQGRSHNYVMGMTAKVPLGSVKAELGVFRSIKADNRSFATLALGVDRQGSVADERISAERDQYAASTSGELRLYRLFQAGRLQHRITAMLRGRVQDRDYGGQTSFSLGSTSLFNRVAVPRPALTYGPLNRSRVKQATLGLAYELAGSSGLRLGASLQRSDYRKFVDPAALGRPDTKLVARPWLITANAVLPVAKGLSLYGGYVEGLEESPNAPDIATNSNEAPPAARTRQMDAGLRYAITLKLTAIVGLFQVEKPYYNLDAARTYGILGDVRNRGVEFSLTGSLLPGLTLVAGTLLLDPRISGTQVESGRIGPRPAGAVRRRSIVNLDWRLNGTSPWSLDMAFESLSGVAGNSAGDPAKRFTTPPRETLGVGGRYRFDLDGGKWLLRGQVINLFNDYGWRVNSSGGYFFSQPRTVIFSVSTDI